MQVDCRGERPHGVVRGNAHKMRLGQGIDLQHLGEATHHTDVGLDDVAAAHLQKPQKLEPAVQRLTGGERALQAALEFTPGLKVFGPDRLFKKQRVIGGQGVAQLHRLRRLEDFGVRIKSDLVLAANRLAQLPKVLRRGPDHLAPAVPVHVEPVGAEFERLHAPGVIQGVHLVPRNGRVGCGVQAGIHLHPVAHMPAQQPVHRHAQRLGRDVPHAMVQHRDGRQAQCPGRKTGLLHQVVRQVSDAPRVLPFQEDQQVIQQGEQR